VEAIQPNLPVSVVIGSGKEKGRWTVVVEIDRAHNVCNRVRGTANEGRRAVAWGKRAVHTQLGPYVGGVWEEGPPFLVLGQRMAFEGEAIRPILAVEVNLVVLDVMIVGDLLADFEERGGAECLVPFCQSLAA